MPDVYNAQFTRFERPGNFLAPIHYIREWQYPKNASNGEAAVFKTVRISEHKWPLPNTYRCNRNPLLTNPKPGEDFSAPNSGWPIPPPAINRFGLIEAGLMESWLCYPTVNSAYVALDDTARSIHARDSEIGRGGLPDDYLEFWLDETDGGEACSK